ncbi:MAG: GNAT family N-acetyltransferase [Pseudonocardiales bacterium]
MDAQLHHNVAEFVALTRPLLEGDPVRHTVALTVTNMLIRAPEVGDPPMLLTVHRGETLAGAAICTPPWALIVSALPAECAGAAAELLAPGYPALPGAVGPRDDAEAFARSWSARTDAAVHERMAQRLFALHGLTPPAGVPGTVRQAGVGDLALLAQWRQNFAAEATGGLRGRGSAAQQTRRALAAGTVALLWEVAGQPVAWASASAPLAGMSRIAPVYTLPQHRGNGYGSAVTAAAAGRARQAGAKQVVLFTDLTNPVTNVIYPRIGFRPVHDAVEFAFTPARVSG